jgi:hypothetical protein
MHLSNESDQKSTCKTNSAYFWVVRLVEPELEPWNKPRNNIVEKTLKSFWHNNTLTFEVVQVLLCIKHTAGTFKIILDKQAP